MLRNLNNQLCIINIKSFLGSSKRPCHQCDNTALPYSTHSTWNDSTDTYIRHIKPTCPDPSKISLTIKTQSSLSRWLAPGRCLPLAGIPHCHLFIASLSQSDSQYPVDRWAFSEAALPISALHKTASPIHCQHIWAPQRERLQWLGLVVTSFPAFAEVTRRCQIRADNWSIWKLWRWQTSSPLRLSPRRGQRGSTKKFDSQFLGNTPNKRNVTSTFDSSTKQTKDPSAHWNRIPVT